MSDRVKAIIEAERAFGLEVKVQVWVLALDSRHGTDISVYKSEADLKRSLYEIVERDWEYEYDEDDADGDHPTNPIPEDRDEAIHQYFDENDDESYSYDNHWLVFTATELAEMSK